MGAVVINTLLFFVNMILGLKEMAALNVASGALCWVPIIINSMNKEKNDE